MKEYFQDLIFIEEENACKVKESRDVKEIVIPETFNGKPVTSIGPWALAGSDNLEKVTIPKSVTEICGNAFAGCNALKSVIVPRSVVKIGNVAFGGCASLTIYCEAENLPRDWNAIWNSWNRPVFWYSETKPEKSGNFWHYVNGKVTEW